MAIGVQEILLILLVVLLVFGAKRIPEIARALGRAAHEFRKARTELEREADHLVRDDDAPPPEKETPHEDRHA